MTFSYEGIMSKGKPHPRAFGTIGRIFDHYVKEEHMLTFEDAVRKITHLPATYLGIDETRGLLREGYYADVVVFDPDTIADKATYKEPRHYTEGIEYVIVNGEIALADGVQTDVCAGRVVKNSSIAK